MFIVDAHCDSIEVAAQRKYGIVNPYNYSQKYNQLQMVALFCCWPRDNTKQCYDRAVRYIGQFMLCMEKEKDKVMQVKSFADIEKAFSLAGNEIGSRDYLNVGHIFVDLNVRTGDPACADNTYSDLF